MQVGTDLATSPVNQVERSDFDTTKFAVLPEAENTVGNVDEGTV